MTCAPVKQNRQEEPSRTSTVRARRTPPQKRLMQRLFAVLDKDPFHFPQALTFAAPQAPREGFRHTPPHVAMEDFMTHTFQRRLAGWRRQEGKVSQEWVGKASSLGFGIFSPPPKRLSTRNRAGAGMPSLGVRQERSAPKARLDPPLGRWFGVYCQLPGNPKWKSRVSHAFRANDTGLAPA
jgi:hypothetical protein